MMSGNAALLPDLRLPLPLGEGWGEGLSPINGGERGLNNYVSAAIQSANGA